MHYGNSPEDDDESDRFYSIEIYDDTGELMWEDIVEEYDETVLKIESKKLKLQLINQKISVIEKEIITNYDYQEIISKHNVLQKDAEIRYYKQLFGDFLYQ